MSNYIENLKATIVLSSLSFLAACSSNFNSQDLATESAESIPMHQYDVNKYQLNKVVCDPMGGPGTQGATDGLIAQLFYLKQGQSHYQDVASYINLGTASTQKLFFSQINIPTRVFNTGFPKETGGIVQNDEGADLIEYFALRFKSVLKLAAGDLPGQYELALLADDGSIMKIIDEDGVKRVVVDNDLDHPTRMGCGQKLYFDSTSSYDVELDYYQGPRQHIALIPLWRRVTDTTTQEVECGKLGNERYFDYNNNSTPQKSYLDMLLRGWKPIAAANWHLPPMAIFNPCVEGTNPIISNFNVRNDGEGYAIVSWTTDIPATAQVLIKDSLGNEIMTQSDNILRTNHSIFLDAEISFGQTYTFQGISISADLGKTLSRVLEVSF
jgi:hypothetical protein